MQRDSIVDLLKKASVELLDAETSEESRSEEAMSEDLGSHDSDPLLRPPRIGSFPPTEMGKTLRNSHYVYIHFYVKT